MAKHMSDWLKIALPGFFGLMTAVIAAFFSARWAVQRVFREKWWERKEKAYSEIIDSLHDMIRYSALMADIELHIGDEKPEHPKKKEFGERYSAAYWRILKMTDIGAFVISEKAEAVLKGLQKRPRLKWEENPPWEIYEEDEKHYREALVAIRAIARKELGV